MKKLTLIFLLFAIALVQVNAAQVTKTITAHIDSVDSVANSEDTDTKDIREFKEVVKSLKNSGLTNREGGSIEDLTGLAAVTSPFVAAFFIILIVLIFNHRNKKAKYELMAKALEVGKELPANFFEEEKKMKQKGSPIQRGVQLVAVGIGLFLLLWFIVDHDVAFVAAIPFSLGIGRLIAIYLEKKNEDNKSEHNS